MESLVRSEQRFGGTPLGPLVLAQMQYLRLQLMRWGLLDLPDDALRFLTTQSGDVAELEQLEHYLRSYPDNRALRFYWLFELFRARRYAEALTALSEFDTAPDLIEPLGLHLQVIRQACRLAMFPQMEVPHCDAMIAGAQGEGEQIKQLLAFAGTLLDLGDNAALPQAEAWCQRAHSIFPYEATVHLQMAAVLITQGRSQEAEPWLRCFEGVARSGETAKNGRRWRAIAACHDRRPNARQLVERCLKERPTSSERQRLEQAVANMAA